MKKKIPSIASIKNRILNYMEETGFFLQSGYEFIRKENCGCVLGAVALSNGININQYLDFSSHIRNFVVNLIGLKSAVQLEYGFEKDKYDFWGKDVDHINLNKNSRWYRLGRELRGMIKNG
jgi:hypothetical protein